MAEKPQQQAEDTIDNETITNNTDTVAEDKAEEQITAKTDTQAVDEVVTDTDVHADTVEELSHEQALLELQDAREKADQYWNKLLLSQADIENLKRRHQRDLENAHKYALENFLKELFPVKDSMELGINAAQQQTDVDKLREGIELTLKQLLAVFEKFGVEEINPLGEKFNPEQHQAMSMQVSDEYEPNTVITVYQKGFTLNKRLLRPAMVVVAKK